MSKCSVRQIGALTMLCLFCEKPHADSYMCEERCEARVSAILALPIKREPRQLTLYECMDFGVKKAVRARGKKRPTPPPLEIGETLFF